MHGFGVYCFANGQCYDDTWHKGKIKGLGKFSFANGNCQIAYWAQGVLEMSTFWNPLTVFAAYHARMLNVVQAARTTAEKAYNVQRVDDRVNKVVVAANIAANAATAAGSKAAQIEKRDRGIEYVHD